MTTSGAAEGAPRWVELATPVIERAAAFYAAVLGWTVDDDGLARHGGRPVARLRTAADAGTLWTTYLAVDDADDVCERLEELGGTVLHGPEDTDEHPGGRFFLALDPGGAEIGGWEIDDPGEIGGPETGAVVGADAASGEPGQSRTFYEALFGFRFEPAAAGATIVHPTVGPLGVLDIAGDALPHWRPRFAVADLDAALDAVVAAGGTVVGRVDDATSRAAVVGDDGDAPIVLVAR